MKVVDVIAEILKRESVEFLSLLSDQSVDRSCGERGHPADRLPPGAGRRRHRGWVLPRD